MAKQATETKAEKPVIDKADRVGLWIVMGLAIAFAALVATFGTVTAVERWIARSFVGQLDAQADLPAEANDGPARATGSFDTAWVTVSNLSDSTSALVFAASILENLIGITVMASVVYLVWRLLEKRPFARSLTRALAAASVALTVGSIGQQVLAGIAKWKIVEELNPTRDEFGGTTFWGAGISLDIIPIAFGILLLLISLAFQMSERLQRDTEGLV